MDDQEIHNAYHDAGLQAGGQMMNPNLMQSGHTGFNTTAPQAPLHVVSSRALSALYVADGAIRIESERPVPNWWRRFWYWALLGWKWEKL